MIVRPQTAALPLTLGLAALLACNGGRAPDGSATPGPGSTTPGASLPAAGVAGKLAVSLVDAPSRRVGGITVNLAAVRAHSAESGWLDVAHFQPPLSIDLLALLDGAVSLGITSVPQGTITQLRLVLAPEVNHVLVDGSEVPLEVPSGIESGIKIMGPWPISSCSTTAVTLDFDGQESIWYHPTGHGEEWILRPVIRTRKVEQAPTACEPPPPAPETGCPDGGCAPGGAESPCFTGGECLSGVCSANRCGQGGPGAPCRTGGDCVAGVCGTEGVCAPGPAGGAGSSCQLATDCLSNACVEGTCQPGLQGSGCVVAGDCATGLSCLAGSCFAPAL